MYYGKNIAKKAIEVSKMENIRLRVALNRIKMYLYLLFNQFEDEDMEKMRHILLLKGILYISTYPYNFVKQYKKMDVIIYKDSDGKLHIMHKGKKLYGKFSWTEKQFSEYYRALQMEQDLHSPHCYTGSGGKYLEERIPGNDDILADIGAAEGIFALDYVDKVKKIYLFECDREWIEPLRKTFQQWEKKVEIVEKYVGKEMNDRSIALDTFFQDTDVTYVKADIEGAEVDMLAGGEKTFKNKKNFALCIS